MIRFLIRLAIFLGSAALGILAASLVLDDVSVRPLGFVVVVVVFTIVQSVLAPFIAKMASRYASAFLGGVGLVSTALALWIATLVSDGLTITGGVTWVLATLIVWLVTALATLVLPLIFLKERRARGTESAA